MFEDLLQAVRSAAAVCERIQQEDVSAAEKDDRSPVTIADYGSQAILCRAIQQHYPDDAVIAEENGEDFLANTTPAQRERVRGLVGDALDETVTDKQLVAWMNYARDRDTAGRTWVIDPIDGTKGFLANRGYTIALGLMENFTPTAGVLGSPGYGDGWLFYAVDGAAYRVPLAGGEPEVMHVSARAADGEFAVVESVETKHAAHDLMASIYTGAGCPNPVVKRVDGQDKYGMVACGDADLYLRVSPKRGYIEKIWDHAAGVAIIKAAGGVVTDGYGQPLDFSHGERLERNSFVVVSNGQRHDAIIGALKRAIP